MPSFQSIFESAVKLQPNERARLVQELLNSLEKPNHEIDHAWEEEAIKRYEAYKNKRVSVRDLGAVMKRYM